MRVSDDTRALVGADILKFLDTLQNKPDAIISKPDVAGSGLFGYIAKEQRLLGLYRDLGIILPVPRQLGGQIIDETNRYLEETEDNAMEGRAAASPVQIIAHDGRKNIACIVTPESFTEPGGRVLEQLGGNKIVPARLPGTPADWEAFTLLHESAHCDPAQRGMTRMLQEYNADLQAGRDYQDAFRQGLVSNAEVPHAFRALRAAIAFTMPETYIHYISTPLVPLNGERPVLGERDSDAHTGFYADMIDANLHVMETIGARFADERTAIAAILRMESRTPVLPGELLAEMREIQSSDPKSPEGSLERCREVLGRVSIPPEIQQDFAYCLREQMIESAKETVKDQPDLLYEFARMTLKRGDYDEGRFADRPAVKSLIERFVDAAERYLPDYYNVPEERIRTGPVATPAPAAPQPAPSYAPGQAP